MKISTIISATILSFTLLSSQVIAKAPTQAKQASTAKQSMSVKQAKPSKKNVHTDKVNLNAAGAEEIAANLTGIGIKKAVAIVEFRKQHGDFKSVQELTLVKGIGEKTLAKNQSRILLK